MRDLNFFSSYNEDKKSKKGFEMYFYGTIGVLLAIIVINVAVSGVRIFMLNSSIKKYNEELNKPEFKAQLNEAIDVNNKIGILSKYEAAVSEVAGKAKKDNVVTDELLNDISGALPNDVTFKDFVIDSYDVTIKGSTHTRAAVAEFEHNLKNLSKIKMVHVNEIEKSNSVGEDYTFEIICVLKEVE